MGKKFIQNVPFDYLPIDLVWNDRRDPHANPMSASPRREEARAPSASMLGGWVDQVYRGKPHPGER